MFDNIFGAYNNVRKAVVKYAPVIAKHARTVIQVAAMVEELASKAQDAMHPRVTMPGAVPAPQGATSAPHEPGFALAMPSVNLGGVHPDHTPVWADAPAPEGEPTGEVAS